MSMELSGKSCCGCGVCSNICAKKAICMQPDEEGFSYPVINNDLCVECGLCFTVCPTASEKEILNYPLLSYAAWNKNVAIRYKSSSGGLFTVIAETILDRGGVVYGASWENGLQLTHIGVEDRTGLEKLRGSKYLQSDMGTCYLEIRNHLRNNRWVCFCGTPCQVAALRLFLRNDYERLITLDFVCHGVPSQKVFDAFVTELETRKGVRLDTFNFRDKDINGWACNSPSSSGLSLRTKKRKKYAFDKAMYVYMNAFMKGMISRESCYSCKFSQKKRVSDFTLGDFWGVREVFPDMKDAAKGVSMLFANTEKSRDFLANIQESVVLQSCPVDEVAARNHNLNHPTFRPQNRDDLKNIFSNKDKIMRHVPSAYYKAMSKYYIKKVIKRFL